MKIFNYFPKFTASFQFRFQIDSHGNRFLAAEETPINTPAIASAIVTKDFKAETCDQISLRVCFILVYYLMEQFINVRKKKQKFNTYTAPNNNGISR